MGMSIILGFLACTCAYSVRTRHSVRATVRSEEKAKAIAKHHPNAKLDFIIVEDIAVEGAFDEAIKSDEPFEAVIHTASPFHFRVTDPKKDLLDPAIIGTTGILKAIHKHAPSVTKVVRFRCFPMLEVCIWRKRI